MAILEIEVSEETATAAQRSGLGTPQALGALLNEAIVRRQAPGREASPANQKRSNVIPAIFIAIVFLFGFVLEAVELTRTGCPSPILASDFRGKILLMFIPLAFLVTIFYVNTVNELAGRWNLIRRPSVYLGLMTFAVLSGLYMSFLLTPYMLGTHF